MSEPLEHRRRFRIESSYRHLRQHRIWTSSRDPPFRLLVVGLALLLRKVGVWVHLMNLPIVYGAPRRWIFPSKFSLHYLVEILFSQSLLKNACIGQTGNY